MLGARYLTAPKVKQVIFGRVINKWQKGHHENGGSHARRILNGSLLVNLLRGLIRMNATATEPWPGKSSTQVRDPEHTSTNHMRSHLRLIFRGGSALFSGVVFCLGLEKSATACELCA